MRALASVRGEGRRLYWTAYLYVGAKYEQDPAVEAAARHELAQVGCSPDTLHSCDVDIAANMAVEELLR